jgi:tetratricopeptide (TPR) repeat protein
MDSLVASIDMQQIVGRQIDLRILEDALNEAIEGRGNTVLISGEAGVGKTALVMEFIRWAESMDPLILTGSALADAVQPFQIFSRALAGAIKKPLFEEHEYRTFTELFVIDRSGLLLAQAAPEDEGLDADIFAGMFSAVQDFVRDSFDRSGGQKGTLGRLEYGDMKILVEHGQNIFLVAVFKGAEHQDMRGNMRRSLHEIEIRYGHVLDKWSGNIGEMSGIVDEITSLARVRFLVRKSMEGVSLEQERTRIADEVLDTLGEMGGRRPVLMLLEDLHWADESSIFVLNYLARNIRNQRTLIVGTLRPGEGKSALVGLGRAREEGNIAEISLRLLDADSTTTLIQGLYPNHRFPGNFMRKLIGQCEGNPFFAKEMLRELEATGSIIQKDGVFLLEEQEIALPSSIEEVVHKRIENLDTNSLALVEFASCIGREFDRNIMTRLKSAQELTAALERLTESGIIMKVNDVDQFSHAMFQSVIYENLSTRWKSHYHKSIGEHFEETYKNRLDTVMYELARHFSKTSEHHKIFEYCRQAGEMAEGSYSPDLAVEYYKNAINAIPRLKMGADAQSHKIEMLERVGEVQGLRGMFEDSLASYALSIEAATDAVTKAKMHRKRANVMTWHGQFPAALEELDIAEKLLDGKEHDELGFLLIARSFINMNTGNFEDTLKLSQAGIDVLEGTNDAEAKKIAGRAWKIMGACHMLKGNYDESLRCHGMGKLIGEELNDPYGLSAAYNNIGNVYLAKGDFPKALEHYEVALELLDKTKDLQGMSYTLNNIGIIHKNRGEFDLALEKYQDCVRVLEKIGDPGGVSSALNNIGNLQNERGDNKTAVETYQRALDIAQKIGDKQQYVSNLCALVPSLVHLGELGRAQEECGRAFELSKELGSKRTEFWSLRNMGVIAAAKGDVQMSEKHFVDAEVGFRQIGMDAEIANTLMERGTMLLESGRTREGRKAVKEATGIFQKAGMEWKVGRCARLLNGSEE